jgi:hypothetical protein
VMVAGCSDASSLEDMCQSDWLVITIGARGDLYESDQRR